MESIERLMLPHQLGAAVNRLAIESAQLVLVTQATGSVGEIIFWQAKKACTITSVSYVPSTASAPSSGSNYQTLLITRYTGTAGTGSTVASGTISNGAPCVAMVALSMGTVTNAAMATGSKLSFQATLTGTATIPPGFLEVAYTVD
jgi:hypothetical protein